MKRIKSSYGRQVKPKFREVRYYVGIVDNKTVSRVRVTRKTPSREAMSDILRRKGTFNEKVTRRYYVTRKNIEITETGGRVNRHKTAQAYAGTMEIGDRDKRGRRIGIFARSNSINGTGNNPPMNVKEAMSEAMTNFFRRVSQHVSNNYRYDEGEGEEFIQQNSVGVEKGYVWYVPRKQMRRRPKAARHKRRLR
jgi:hypothetical protein